MLSVSVSCLVKHFSGMEEERRRILSEAFGDSSSSEDDEDGFTSSNNNTKWEQIKEIKGLWLCREFLSTEKQSSLLASIEQEGWFTEASHNQAMRFGDLPAWAIELSRSIHKATAYSESTSSSRDLDSYCRNNEEACPMPSNLLWREPFFDQLIVNAYQPGEGICAHIDLMRFEDGIGIISLESSCAMHFTRVEDGTCNSYKKEAPIQKIPVFLTPGSLIIMCGEARYLWMHEINRKPGFQVWGGKEIDQQRRISVTLRKLCISE